MSKSLEVRFLLLTCVLSLSILLNTSRSTIVQADGPFMVYLPTVMRPEDKPIILDIEEPNDNNFDTILRVNPNNQTSSCNVSIECQTIQQAIDAAKNDSGTDILIKLAQATYTSNKSTVVDMTFFPGESNKNITVFGGYDPSSWTVTTNDTSRTVIDGQNARRGVRIVSIYASEMTLGNLTIQNGTAIEPVANIGVFSGGGLLCRNDNPNKALFVELSLTNILFQNNWVNGTGGQAVSGGGASLYFRCSGNLNNVTFNNNSVQGGAATDGTRGDQALGGGLFLSGGFGAENQETTLTANNVTFTNNRVIAGDGGTGFGDGLPDALGGGAAIQLSRATIDGVIAKDNEAIGGQASSQAGTASGGGLFFELNTGTVVVKNGQLTGNKVTGGASSTGTGGIGSGGALMATDSTLKVENMTMVDNQSFGGAGNDGGDAGGGAMYFTTAGTQPSVVTGANLIIADNVCQAGEGQNRYGGGGGVFSQDTTLTLNHVTLARNSVLNTMLAPAIISQHNSGGSSTLTINYSIVSDHEGRDIFNNPRAPIIAQTTYDTLHMNSVLSHNNTNDLESGTIYSSQPGLADGTFNVSNIIEGDPSYVNEGSPEYNYHIMANSDAIDQAQGSSTTFDIDNQSRPNGSAADLGADEFLP